VLNLLRYNVFPSRGGSARGHGANLYGVEPATFYLKNLALNFAHNAVLALFAVPLGALAGSARYGRADGSRAAHFRLMTTHAPFPLALLLFSSLAHKEERFMYVAYSALCAGAGAAVGAFFDLCVAKSARSRAAAKRAGRKPSSGLVLLAAIGAGAACALTAAFGASRVAALALGYGAPARAFALGLPTQSDDSTRHVCLGDDSWHRFPSSFFLPSDSYRIKFLDGAFDGALPVPFEKERGGTSFGAATLNDANRGEKEQRVADAARECDYVVEYAPPRVPEEEDERSSEYTSRPYLGKPPVNLNPKTVGENVGENQDEPSEDELDPPRRAADRGAAVSWTLLWEAPFLDAGKSPALSRAFFVPGWSSKRNVFGTYRVYGKEAR
jgi:alpha-1,2-mannosyltransferase